MRHYLVESYEFSLQHNGRSSSGVVGKPTSPSIKEKIYLHVIGLTDAEIAKLAPRVDEDGNRQSGRLALPREESFWIAVDGEIAWPNLHAPKMTSACRDAGSGPAPVPLEEADLDRLASAGLTNRP